MNKQSIEKETDLKKDRSSCFMSCKKESSDSSEIPDYPWVI